MKVTFRKDYSHWSTWLPYALYFFIFGGAIAKMGLDSNNYFLMMIPVPFIFYTWIAIRSPFEVSEDDKLHGNGIIDISLINNLERKNKGVTVYYFWPNGKAEQKRFFPLKDIDTFISTLLEINPNIKLN